MSKAKSIGEKISQRSVWSKILKYLPHERVVHETPQEIEAGYIIKRQTDDANIIQVREVRDEATRPWWKFFDEYEYRHTKSDAARHDWWRWFEKDTPPEEKRLILKLDLLITLVVFLGFWSKSLDQNNLNNAYVSGMKEDISMVGDALIDTQVLFQVAIVVFALPMAYIMPRYPPAYVLFIAELGWSLFTLLTYRVENLAILKAFRFFVGFFEAAFFPTVHHIFTNWYKPSEVSSRAGFFYFGLCLGNLTSSLLQSGIYNALNGMNGLSGWRWMYLIDSVVSFAIAFITLFSIPGTPFKCYSLWLTDDDIKLARKRMRARGLDETVPSTKQFFSWKPWKSILTSWHFWAFTIANIGGFAGNSASNGSFALWLKSLNRYSVGKLNNLTAIPPALGILYITIVCFGADITRQRFLMITFSQVMNLIGNAILAVWYVPENVKWFAYSFGYWSWSQSSVFYPLYNDILRRDANTRAIEWVVSQVLCAQAFAWMSKLLYPTTEAPKFQKGFTGAACFSALQAIGMVVALVYYKKDERKFSYENGIIVYNSAKGETLEAAEAEFYDKIKSLKKEVTSTGESDNNSEVVGESVIVQRKF